MGSALYGIYALVSLYQKSNEWTHRTSEISVRPHSPWSNLYIPNSYLAKQLVGSPWVMPIKLAIYNVQKQNVREDGLQYKILRYYMSWNNELWEIL